MNSLRRWPCSLIQLYILPNLLSMQQEALEYFSLLISPHVWDRIQAPAVLLLWCKLSAHFGHSQKVSQTLLQITSVLQMSSSVMCPLSRPFGLQSSWQPPWEVGVYRWALRCTFASIFATKKTMLTENKETQKTHTFYFISCQDQCMKLRTIWGLQL